MAINESLKKYLGVEAEQLIESTQEMIDALPEGGCIVIANRLTKPKKLKVFKGSSALEKAHDYFEETVEDSKYESLELFDDEGECHLFWPEELEDKLAEKSLNENTAMKAKYLPLAKKALNAYRTYGETIDALNKAAKSEGEDSDMAQYLEDMEVTLFNEDVYQAIEELVRVIKEGE